jgi:hypothetical protein
MTSLVILSNRTDSNEGRPAIADRRDLIARLAPHNMAPEGPDSPDSLYGPGIRIDLTPGEDPVSQALLEIVDEDIAWVRNGPIARLLKALPIRIVDPISGRELRSEA